MLLYQKLVLFGQHFNTLCKEYLDTKCIKNSILSFFPLFKQINKPHSSWRNRQHALWVVNVSLNANGIRQVKVSLRVQKLKIERIVSSPLMAKQTAEIINSFKINRKSTLKECCGAVEKGNYE